ncbi:MAG: DUF4232 domain-containing protein [Acidimicrobiales bacterium]
MSLRLPPRRTNLALGLAAALALSACSSSPPPKPHRAHRRHHSTTTTTTTAAPAASTTTTAPPPSTTTTTAPSAVAGGCGPAQLGLARTSFGVAAGSIIDVFTLTNTSTTSCSLQGYPGVALVDAQGQTVPTQLQRISSPAPTKISLAPGAHAYFRLQSSDGTGFTNPTCPQATQVNVIAPNDYTAISTKTSIAPCTSHNGPPPRLLVSAVAAGTAPGSGG